ncbi:MAG TPA: magnesium chelatase [Firmicutes bacterium]|nr:magnesium chelatase [Bacillota bacterium]
MKSFEKLVRHEGNDTLFRCMEISIVSTAMGVPLHLHAEGLRGTGKSTIMLAARQVLPTIRRVRGCQYNCDPERPHCPEHKDLSRAELLSIGIEEVPMPFLEISHSAKVGTVVGSIDLEELTSGSSKARLLPGTIPMANRGIIFIDEINRLAETSPEIADVLLAAMGTKPGRVKIEETGMKPVEMPVACSVWAASNPDEEPGALEDIRKQLADRFDLTVSMGRPTDPSAIVSILRKEGFAVPLGNQVRENLLRACERGTAEVPQFLDEIVAQLYIMFNLESLRSAEALRHVASVNAALMGRGVASIDDLIAVAQPCLRHRVEMNTLAQIIKYLAELKEGKKQSEVPAGASTTTKAAPRHQQQPASALDRLLSRVKESMESYRAGVTPSAKHSQDSKGGASDSGGGAKKPLDPMTTPLAAPPRVARSIPDLRLDELVRTEEELR